MPSIDTRSTLDPIVFPISPRVARALSPSTGVEPDEAGAPWGSEYLRAAAETTPPEH